jgi:prepilin-type processing-associated H-X9-DG protein
VIGIIALLIGLLIPALTRAREQAKAAKCLSNLHQMGVAAFVYTAENRGQFPLAVASASLTVYWDFDETVPTNIRPGLLWGGKTNDPFTGYNYNTSYVGCGYGETTPLGNLRMKSAALGQLRPACAIALFGDAMSSGGTNKFMRAPILMSGTDIGDSVSISTRLAGTQGARHLGKANVCWMDGHASPVPLASNLAGQNRQGVVTYGAVSAAAGTGFLSADNTAYSGQ